MGKIRRRLITGGVAVGIAGAAVGGNAWLESLSDNYPTSYVNPADEALVQKTVADTGMFWASQGLGLGKSLRAEVAVDEGVFNCGGTEVTSDSMNAVYCSADNTLNISVGLVNQARSVAGSDKAEAAIRGTVRNMVGEFVLNQDPYLMANPPTDEDEAAFYRERVIACLNGVATYGVAAVDPALSVATESPTTYQVYLHTGDSRTEGGPLARAFQQGVAFQTADRNKCVGI